MTVIIVALDQVRVAADPSSFRIEIIDPVDVKFLNLRRLCHA